MRPSSSLVVFAAVIVAVAGLFEDQAFKFDWRKSLVGIPVSARFWETPKDAAVIVRSEGNEDSGGIVASLDADSGAVRWRHELSGERVLDVTVAGEDIVNVVSVAVDSGLVLARTFRPGNGALVSEQETVTETSPSDANIETAFIHGNEVNVVFVDKSGNIQFEVFDFKTGGDSVRSPKLTSGSGDAGMKCDHTNGFFVCMSAASGMAYFTTLPVPEKGAKLTALHLEQLGVDLAAVTPSSLSAMPGSRDTAVIKLKVKAEGSEQQLVLRFADGKLEGTNVVGAMKKATVTMITGCKNTDDVILVEQGCVKGSRCTGFDPEVKVTMQSRMRHALDAPAKFKTKHEQTFRYPRNTGGVVAAWAACQESGHPAEETVYQVVLLASDGSLYSLTPMGNVLWSREEALASVAAVEMLPMPIMADGDGEDGPAYLGGSGSTDVAEQFFRRLKHHWNQLYTTVKHYLEIRDVKTLIAAVSSNNRGMSDEFGIRKMIVIATEKGKVAGIDSQTGEIVWHLYFPFDVTKGILKMFVQRGMGHFGLDPVCALVYTDKHNSAKSLVTFNPSTGAIMWSVKQLKSDLKQVIMLHHSDENHLKPLLLLYGDGGEFATLEPASAANHLSSLEAKMFITTVDEKSGGLSGHQVFVASATGAVTLMPIWTLSNPGAKLLHIVGKPAEERVHSQGRVMADRNVLFKYVNPNLALALSEGTDSLGKIFINVYLVDLVTGRVVFSATHKRVMGPYRIVHSENWAVYTYYNEKSRRNELTSLELFEGNTQSNASVFSSVSTEVTSPLVERQAFILATQGHVAALKDTLTEKGITSKNLLLATTTGAVYNVPRHILDPRRPNINTPPEMREPGLPPYIPELALPPEMILNYNQTVSSPRGVVTAATGLESTTVAFVYGLDMYCTSMTPSKGFDVLKEDFDYSVISAVLFGLVAAAYITRRLSQRKALNAAWK